jgi:hypothetical protein
LLPIQWPDGNKFAFTIFDDTDLEITGNYERVYSILRESGFRTTKSVWPLEGNGPGINRGATCEDPEYLAHMLELQRDGFEIGYHGTTYHTVERAEIVRGLAYFNRLFGHYPRTMANHIGSKDNIYWGSARLSGARRSAYNLLTLGRNRKNSMGHCKGSPYFWGDLCQEKVEYVRNFTFSDVNTLAAVPLMPYHDPTRPFVNQWFAASEATDAKSFVAVLTESNQDRLEHEGGACIMYTHFGFRYQDRSGVVDPRFVRLIKRLSRKRGWFVPVATLLDYIRRYRGEKILSPSELSRLECKWLRHKVFSGGTK